MHPHRDRPSIPARGDPPWPPPAPKISLFPTDTSYEKLGETDKAREDAARAKQLAHELGYEP
jgi:hypothetical protein